MGYDPADVKSIFLDAIEHPPDQWAAYLDGVCAQDAPLRARVEELLRAHAQLGGHRGAAASTSPGAQCETIAERLDQTIGRYKLVREIGEGGMGVVYLAQQQEPVHRSVALKIIKPGMDTRAVIDRFEAERQALALMDHPNIAKVLDAGTTEESSRHTPCAEAADGTRSVPATFGRPYFVMELVQGVPLTDYCDRNNLTIRQRLELFVQVCHAVQHAHTKGIIHRDLKPSHVLVTLCDGNPVPKIIDFGIAKAIKGHLTDKTLVTSLGLMVGTPLYMSPEQAEMGGTDVDTRSDIYSLGATLYELLTGTTPFDQERVREAGLDEIRRMIREEEPPRPSIRITQASRSRLPGGTSVPGADTSPGPARQAGPAESIAACRKSEPAKLSRLLRRDLDWIVMKTLQKDRARRYQTAGEFAQDIERYLSDEPIEARPPTLADRAAKWARRHRAMVWSSIAILIAAPVILAISTILVLRERAETIRQRDNVLAREATLRRHAYAADVNWAWRAYNLGQAGQARKILEQHRPLAGEEDLRSFAWYCLWRSCQSSSTALEGHTDVVYCVAFSPDGKTLASGGKDRTVILWDLAAGKPLRTLQGHSDDVNWIAFSHDGQLMATADEGFKDPARPEPKVMLWDPVGGRLLKTLTGFQYPVAWVSFVPGAKTLLVAELNWNEHVGKTSLWDPATGRRLWTLDGWRALSLSSDGRIAASGKGGRMLGILDLATQKELARADSPDVVMGAAFSPDGRALVTGSRDKCAHLWDAADLRHREVLRGHFGWMRSVSFSPNGRVVASAGDDSEVRLWEARSGAPLRVLGGHTGAVWCTAFSPDGNTLATGSSDRSVRVWNRVGDVGATILPRQPQAVTGIAFLPDNRTLATAGWDSHVRLWDSETGQLASWLELPGKRCRCLAVSGQRLAVGSAEGTIDVRDLAAPDRSIAHIEQPVFEVRHPVDGSRVGYGGVSIVVFSPDGLLLAGDSIISIESNTVLWDVASAREHFRMRWPGPYEGIQRIAFAPDGKTLTSVSGTDVKLLDLATREVRTLATGHVTAVRCLAYSPDGTILGTGGNDLIIKLFDTQTHEVRAVLLGHRELIQFLAFSPDGNTLASASAKGELKLWDVFMGQELVTLSGHWHSVGCLTFSPDGARLAIAGETSEKSGEVMIWHAPRRDE